MALKDTMFLDKWVEVYIPTVTVPSVKGACRELGIDVKDGQEDGNMKGLEILICTYSQLMAVAGLAGTNASFNAVNNLVYEGKLG